ncbi:MAG: repeat protein, partial [Bryobacterales bacterium]|nr:repeat protein [Bryobacterales bacterium]
GGDLFTASIYEPSAGGVFRLKGDGVEWERVAAPSALSGEQILNLAGGPEAVGKGLYAATYRSVLGSSDAGKTWKRIPGPTATGRLTGLGEISGRLLLASESGLYRSENGKPWTKVMLPARAAGVRSLIPIDAKSIAATTSTGLLLSSDGISWSEASAIPGDPRIYGLVSPGAGRLLAATSAGLMQSDDLGSSWQRVHWTLENNSVSAICVHPLAPNHVYLAQFGAVYESSDAGQTWAAASSPGSSMISVRALAIVTSQPGRLYALTQHQGMFALPVSITPGGPSNSKPYQLEKYDRKRR